MDKIREEFYNKAREEYDINDAQAVGWRNQEALDKRFNTTKKYLDIKYVSRILDYGCGVSLNLYKYLDNPLNYVGVDINLESLKVASQYYDIPLYNGNSKLNKYLIKDENLEIVSENKYDIIVVNGVFQEFDSVESIKSTVTKLASMLDEGGQLLCMTPCNRKLNFRDDNFMRLSVYDVVSICESIGYNYTINIGDLGEHIIFKIVK